MGLPNDPMSMDPNALIARLEARYGAALQEAAAEKARMIADMARLETALAAAIEQLQQRQPES